MNAASNGDDCPICYTPWNEFLEPRVAAILPCSHAVCAECLLNYYTSCEDVLTEEDDRCQFGCPLCRLNLPSNVFHDVAKVFVKKRLMSSFTFLAEKLPFEKDYIDDLVISLLSSTHKFDLSKIDYYLFNLLSLIDQNPEAEICAEDKQKFYEQARAPVKHLRSKLIEIRSSLTFADTESDEGKEINKQLKEINVKLQTAIKNASRDIYERVNSKGKLSVKVNGKEVLRVDLHGLHVDEAKEIVNEYVLPVLDVSKQIMIITGRGVHSQNGKSVLKNAIKEYFTSLSIKWEDVVKNEGAIYVFSKSGST